MLYIIGRCKFMLFQSVIKQIKKAVDKKDKKIASNGLYKAK
tara:strand:- start:256 stop:378 length:123 start_codon:yes stop_codon:yes gene_type:complete